MTKVQLYRDFFQAKERPLLKNSAFTATIFRYDTGVVGLKVTNHRGTLTLLPFEGLMIWDAIMDGFNLKMKTPFREPRPGKQITDSYGPFQFHSGLLASGNPGPGDHHLAHGEFPLSQMDRAYLEVDEHHLTIRSQVEYVKGFGDHYFAEPAVTLTPDSAVFKIEMTVKNLSNSQDMPLQYLTHLNYRFIPGAKMSQNIPDQAFNLRTSIPDHIHPTPSWLAFTQQLADSGKLIDKLDDIQHFNPEIVYFGDNLNQQVTQAEFKMQMDDQHTAKVAFDTREFPNVTRWLMADPDLQVAAFALPATSRTEGRLAAKKAGTLIMLKPQESRHFTVLTGLETTETAKREF